MKRLFIWIIAIALITVGSFVRPAGLTLPAQAAPDTISSAASQTTGTPSQGSLTVTVQLDNTQPDSQAASQLVLDLKQNSSIKDHQALAMAASNEQFINFSPIIFSGLPPGQYQVCLDGTSKCKDVIKTNQADSITFATSLTADEANQVASGTSSSKQNATSNNGGCDGQELGWLICPVVRMAQNAISSIETNVIVPFLQTPPLSVTNANGGKTAIYSIWEVSRALADALLIVVFLVLIFAHTTSLGADAYTIRRTLPRLVVAAILIQFSFLIASLSVDATNILGQGITGLINNVLNATGVASVHTTFLSTGLGLTALTAGLVAAIGSVLTGAILVILIGAFFGVLGVFLTLIARQIIITMLIVTAPIAFLLMVLPNTQSVFDTWRKNFIRILLMYPLIVLLFASSRIFGVIATATNGGGVGSSDVRSLISMAAVVVPLFLIPATFKFSGSLLNTANEWANKYGRDPLKKRTEDSGWYKDLKDYTNRRKTNLHGGQGISFGAATNHKAVALRGNWGRAFGGPANFGNAAQTRSMKALRKVEADEGKRIDDMNLSPDGWKMIVGGSVGAKTMLNNQRAEIKRLQATNASDAEIAGAQRKLESMESTEKLARQFYGNASAQMAAVSKLADAGQLDNDDRQALYDRSRKTGDIGKSYAQLVWGNNFKLREGNPVLQNTSLDGYIDFKGVEKNITGRSTDSFKSITKDGWDALVAIGMADKIPAPTLATIMDPENNNSIAEVNIQTLRHYQEAARVANQDFDDQRAWLHKTEQGRGTNKYELLKNRDFLGGLIADSTNNTVNEKRLRQIISEDLESVATKADYAATIDGKTRADANTVKDDDWKDFVNYRDNVWKRRVNIATGEKKENWDIPPEQMGE